MQESECEGLIIKLNCIDAAWGSPGADHKMVLHDGRR